MQRSMVIALVAVFASQSAEAQSSIGLPPRVRVSVGPYAGLDGPAGTTANLGVIAYKDILNPTIGILGFQFEAYGGAASNGGWTGAAAVGLRSPSLRLGTGLEMDLRNGEVAPFLSIMHPLLRGGLFGGGLIHATWVPGGQNTFRAGVALPVAQLLTGEGRPLRDHVRIVAEKERWPQASGDMRDNVLRVNDVVVPPLNDLRHTSGLFVSDTLTTAAMIIAAYHDKIDRALGRALADTLRAILLDKLLLPYNKLLGQKREPDALAPFTTAALKDASKHGAQTVFVLADIAQALDEVVRVQRRRIGDERLVWLPLQLALRENQYNTQKQLDALLERATTGEFSDSNEVVYIPNDQFQWELFHSIRQARTYHVLWIHEFRGVNDNRVPDRVAYQQVAYGYLTALLERVRAYDSTRVFPEYHIILDQYYYELARSRGWMQLLRDPLNASLAPRAAPAEWHRNIDSLQSQLRLAVAQSRTLQEELVSQGKSWLNNRVSVHVHITQQADPAFLTHDMLPLIGMTDNALHDHRKIVFYDLLESDRYRGALIVTGMGVGELFSGPGWDDRAAIVKGAAAHEVKRQAARLLIRNGFNENRLPAWLQASVDSVPPALRTPTPRFDPNPTRTMQLHNDVGYGDKSVTVAKAMLYSLLPSGTVVKVANPLWINPLWGSLLLGHSLRGGRVLIVSPSLENSFFSASVMSLVSEQLALLINARQTLDAAIKRSGGMLGIGIYDLSMSADDIPARIDTALARRSRTPWLQKLEPFSKEVSDSLRAVSKLLRATVGNGSSETPGNERSKLHLKLQFVASAEAWDDLFLQRGWGAALAEHYRSIARLSRTRPQFAEFHKVDPTTVSNVGGTLALRQEMMAKEPERVLYYMIFGSFNEDYRSAILDGEAVILISQFGAAVGMPDFILLPSLCTWVESEEELYRYLPRRVGWLTRFLKILY